MPTYEYKCPNGHLFEKFFQQMTDKQHERCPKCGKRATRVISAGVGLVFKGSGFYTTDYKRAGEKKGEGEAGKGAGVGGGGEAKPVAEPKSESKPDSGKKKESKDK
jgi:putative FmdB family regulatory protein